MKRFLINLALLFAALPVLGQDSLPRDVQRFVNRREDCDKVRGDRSSINELSRDLRKLCSGIDKELVQLKKKYAANSTIMQLLHQFEVRIEASGSQVLRDYPSDDVK